MEAAEPVAAKGLLLACLYACVFGGLVACVGDVALRSLGIAAVGPLVDFRPSGFLEWLLIAQEVLFGLTWGLGMFVIPPLCLVAIAVAKLGQVERARARLTAMAATLLVGGVWVAILTSISSRNDWCGVQPSALQVVASRGLYVAALSTGFLFGGLALAQRAGKPRRAT